MFRVKLFALNQLCAFSSSVFALKYKSSRFEPDSWSVVSSAKSKVKKSIAVGRSLIKIRKSRGPRTDPWETPHFIS